MGLAVLNSPGNSETAHFCCTYHSVKQGKNIRLNMQVFMCESLSNHCQHTDARDNEGFGAVYLETLSWMVGVISERMIFCVCDATSSSG